MVRWVTVMSASALPPDRPVTVRVNNHDLALAACSGGGPPHVLDNRCPHRGGQLGDGRLDGENIICGLHGYDFDLHTGVSRYDPHERVAIYPAREHEGAIQVDADAVPALPADHDDGYLDRWARRSDPEIRGYGYLHGLADGPPVSAMGTRQTLRPSWDDILLLPAQLSRQPRLDDEPLSLATTIGRRARRPLELAVPFTISHMSFGALSVSAKTALARVSAELGTAIGSGEGGMLDEERAAATLEIFEMATGYFGWDEQHIRRADAIEIKFGQSAKAGSGGLLPGAKVTARIAEVRGIAPGEAAHSPARFTDIAGPDALRARVDWIRERLDGGPVGIKFAAGRVEDDLDAAIAAGVDFVTIDGRGGGTGAGPDVLKDNLTIPIQYALDRAVRHLAARGIDDLDIIATGGFRTAGDVTKALGLGASAVALATGALIAIGCQQYLACHTGRCPVGIATQRADVEARFDIGQSAERGSARLGALRDEIAMLLRAIGVADVRSLTVDDLATLDSEIASHTRIRHA
ncbi:MAG: glutamate synthase-related protein [Chloroflexi bacterium]|nr:glutamate synthase-related protein [Chloroflexota bacterium]MDA1004497.1 glutamate synthase-related protein [Chloroflexota bacterium]